MLQFVHEGERECDRIWRWGQCHGTSRVAGCHVDVATTVQSDQRHDCDRVSGKLLGPVRVVVKRAANLKPEVSRRGSLLIVDFPRTGSLAERPPVFEADAAAVSAGVQPATLASALVKCEAAVPAAGPGFASATEVRLSELVAWGRARVQGGGVLMADAAAPASLLINPQP